jgi:excisionase family DNA binding protein
MHYQSNQSDSQPDMEELITLKEAAELSGLSHSHLRLLVRKGELWGKKMGRDWFTNAQAVQEYLAQDRRPGPKPK